MSKYNENQKQADNLVILKKKKESEIAEIKKQLRILDVQIRQR